MVASIGPVHSGFGTVPGLIVSASWVTYYEDSGADVFIIAEPIGDGLFRLDGIIYPSEQAVRDELLLMAANKYKCESIQIKYP